LEKEESANERQVGAALKYAPDDYCSYEKANTKGYCIAARLLLLSIVLAVPSVLPTTYNRWCVHDLLMLLLAYRGRIVLATTVSFF
jgi:hypothetical protein